MVCVVLHLRDTRLVSALSAVSAQAYPVEANLFIDINVSALQAVLIQLDGRLIKEIFLACSISKSLELQYCILKELCMMGAAISSPEYYVYVQSLLMSAFSLALSSLCGL